jgi:hypothetical protein
MATTTLNGNWQPSPCPSQKKCYPTRDAAEQFARGLAEKYPEQVKQHAYACEDCSNWHLSAMSPDAQAMVCSRSYLPQVPENKAARLGTSAFEGRKPEIAELFRQGFSFKAISEKTEIPYSHVYNICIALGLHQPKTNPRISEGLRASQSKSVRSLETLSSEEENLLARLGEMQALLREIQTKKHQLLEASMLRIGPHNGSGLIIEKEGNVLVLSFAEAEELAERLIDNLPTQPPTAN